MSSGVFYIGKAPAGRYVYRNKEPIIIELRRSGTYYFYAAPPELSVSVQNVNYKYTASPKLSMFCLWL